MTKLFADDGWLAILGCSTAKKNEGCSDADAEFVRSLKNNQELDETAKELLLLTGVEVERCYCDGSLCNGEFIH